ncbi:MAG TPA: hypothetical protein VI895_07385 [Bdellovibrionota bacterium]|nr:hypothetical protein [Bdellovibrionota bacterium]
MSRRRKVLSVGLLGLVALTGALAFNYPSFWASHLWPVPQQQSGEIVWDYWIRAASTSLLPKWLTKDRRNIVESSQHGLSIRLHDAAMKQMTPRLRILLNNSKEPRQLPPEKLRPPSYNMDVFPSDRFGITAALPKDSLALEVLGPRQLDCRFILNSNPKPVDGEGGGPIFFFIRAVCPCRGYPGRWSVLEKIGGGDLVRPWHGGTADLCIPIDPKVLLNRPPLWEDCKRWEKPFPTVFWFDQKETLEKDRYWHINNDLRCMKGNLEDGNLPLWPIYVEHHGKLRRASEADMKFVSQGIFKIPD